MNRQNKLIAILTSIFFIVVLSSMIASVAVEPEDLTNVVVRDIDGDVVTVKWDPITNRWRCFKEDGRESIHSGLAPNENGMWYCSAGGVLFDYTNPVEFEGDTWYVLNGKVATDYTGEVSFFGKTYSVERGKILGEVTTAKATPVQSNSSALNGSSESSYAVYVVLALLGAGAVWLIAKKRKKKDKPVLQSQSKEKPAVYYPMESNTTTSYKKVDAVANQEQDEKYQKYQYKKKNVVTNREQRFYKELKPIADKLGYTVLTKIRMADLVDPTAPDFTSARQGSFAKIRSKHVDFALADPENLNIHLLIELDDSTHQWSDRKERDVFVDYVYRTTGYPILHVYSSHDLESQIRSKLGI